MPFVDGDLLGMADDVRGIRGPDEIGNATTQVAIVQRVWVGGIIGSELGYTENVVATLPQHYLVRPLKTNEIMSSGGQYEMGDVRVQRITPKFTASDGVSGGFSEADLHPVSTVEYIETVYKLTGAHKGEYQFVALESWRAIGYGLVLRRRITQPVEP